MHTNQCDVQDTVYFHTVGSLSFAVLMHRFVFFSPCYNYLLRLHMITILHTVIQSKIDRSKGGKKTPQPKELKLK